MNRLLFERSSGALSPNAFARLHSTRLLYDIHAAPDIRFDGGEVAVISRDAAEEPEVLAKVGTVDADVCGHQGGVNALAIDRFEGRLLLSGGADSSISLWDLEHLNDHSRAHTFRPKGKVSRAPSTHKFGVTELSFYPFDTAAFLSSSYDHTLKLYSTESLAASASFDLDSIIYTHDISPIASHLLVACGTQHPAVRLVDLRSGSSAHSLAGHHGAVLSLAWSPTKEYILASGDINGTVRVWDVRKSAGTLGLLDMEDSIGIIGYDGLGLGWKSRETAKAHNGAVNGLSWTDDGSYIITAGHDNRVRIWDAATGANTLASFGPILKNSHQSTLSLLTTPTAITPPGKDILIFPNEQELLVFSLHEGKLLKRLKIPGSVAATVRSRGGGERNVRNRVTALAWRGAVEGMYSGHSDGQIRAWGPDLLHEEDDDGGEVTAVGKGKGKEAAEAADEAEASTKRKREVLDNIFRDLTTKKITFG